MTKKLARLHLFEHLQGRNQPTSNGLRRELRHYAKGDEMGTYKIVRFKFHGDKETARTGLTLEEAKAHCNDPDTRGDGWFDGYTEEKPIRCYSCGDGATYIPPAGTMSIDADIVHAVVDSIRHREQQEINSNSAERATLEERHGQVWDTEEMVKEYDVLQYVAPYVVVERKSDRRKGSFQFQHYPRYYFNWEVGTNE